MEELIVNIEFNSETKKITIPLDHKSFLEKIQKLLGINSDLISGLAFEYKDSEGDIYNMNKEDAYKAFIFDFSSVITLYIINNNKKPDLDMDLCTKNFIKYNENINDNNINNIDNENNDIINDNDIHQNNESNNDSMDNSNMNIINKKEDYISLLVNNINKEGKNKKENKNNVINLFISIKVKKSVFSKTFLTFFEVCFICNSYPLVNTLYYCLECKISICEQCENESCFNHRHNILKIQTKEQYYDLIYKKLIKENSNKSRLKRMFNYLKYYAYIFFSKKRYPELMTKLQIAREKYTTLNNVNDNKLKKALILAKGNIDEAVNKLKNL